MADQQEQSLFRLLVYSYLAGKPMRTRTVNNTFAVLVRKGYVTPEALLAAGYDKLVEALDEGGYARLDEVTSRRLLELSARLRKEYGSMAALVARPDLNTALQTFKGIGPVTARIFCEGLERLHDDG